MLLWAAREAVVPPSFDELGDKIRKVKTGTIGGAAAPRPHGLQLGAGAWDPQDTSEFHDQHQRRALVPAEAAALRLQVPGDVSDDHGGPAQRTLRPTRRQVHGQE